MYANARENVLNRPWICCPALPAGKLIRVTNKSPFFKGKRRVALVDTKGTAT